MAEYINRIKKASLILLVLFGTVSNAVPEESFSSVDDSAEKEINYTWKVNGYLESENFFMVNKSRDESDGETFIGKIENHAFFNLKYGDDNIFIEGKIHGYQYPVENVAYDNRFLVNELYLRWLTSVLEMKIGRQLVKWGTADAFNPTSYFSPVDLSEFLFKDDDELYLGADALSAKFFIFDDYYLQMVCVPQAQTGKLPSRGSAWEMKFPDKETAMLTLPVEYRDSEKGFSPVPENISYGGRFAGSASFSIFSVDYSVSGFHGIDRNPVMVPELEFTGIMPSGILITPQYYKITSYGADSAIAIGDFTVNLEGTYSHDKRALTKIEEGSMQLPSVEKTGFFNGSAGINWLIDGEDLTLTVEYAKGYFRDNKKYEAPMFSSLLIGSLTFKILNGSVEFEARGMYNTKDKDWVAMPKICYDFKNGLTVEIEGAVMEGRSDSDNSTVFGMYNTRDMARFRTKFTF